MRIVATVLEELARLDVRPKDPEIPEDVSALGLLQMAYRGQVKPTAPQMRAAIEALPFEAPKLSALAVGHMSENEFSARLERAIGRSTNGRRAPLALPAPSKSDD